MLIRRKTMMSTVMHDINVIQTHTNLVSSRIVRYQPYTASVVCDEGYSVYEITIKMGGVDITSTAYDPTYNMISIASVTGDVDIECYAMHTLPSDYIRVDGIKNPSNAYIDTGYKISYKNILTVDFTRNGGTAFIVSSKATGTTTTAGTILYDEAGTMKTDANKSGLTVLNGVASGRNIVVFNHSEHRIYVNGVYQKYIDKKTDTDARNLWLYRNYYQLDKVKGTGLIIHACYIKDFTTRTYERYYIPCLNASGVAGFWDAARGVFQGSSNSTAFEAVGVISATFNATSTTNATKLTYDDTTTAYFKSMYIDGVKQSSVVKEYTFATTGDHVVRFVLAGTTTTGENVFKDCSSLKSVTIPSGIQTISNWSFMGCLSLQNIALPNGVKTIGRAAFSSCTSLANVTIPNSVTSIGISAFNTCSSLTNITIPSGVASIEDFTFQNCIGLTSVTISNGVASIGGSAFRDCSGLISITSLATTAPTIINTTFRNVKTGGTLTVPTGSTGYDVWMGTSDYYLGKYGWTKVEQQ